MSPVSRDAIAERALRARPTTMLDVAQALELVLQHARSPAPTRVSLSRALGLALAEDVRSDIDSPPHDKALVDGYAVRAADLAGGTGELRVVEEVTAGAVPTHTITQGAATRIMTGAPIPAGADAVVMVEQTELHDSATEVNGAIVKIAAPKVTSGQNILPRAASMKRGEIVLRAGCRIRAIEAGLLAEFGRAEVSAIPRPSVALLATGNELVPADATPAPGQIRNSNGPMLAALADAAGADVTDLGIAPDNEASLSAAIRDALTRDVAVLSGGVSAGVLDLVPAVLARLGVEQVFHKVRLKPGMPLWFGTLEKDNRKRLVFGLPGNPVSSLVCFELFVKPALRALAGRSDVAHDTRAARLATEHQQRGDRATYWPATLQREGNESTVQLLGWKGSADLATLAAADCLAVFPPGTERFPVGTTIEVVLL
jgi:molybdopterin molybdotransferase